MKILNLILFSSVVTNFCNSAYSQTQTTLIFDSKIDNIPEEIQKNMQKYTWNPSCPVSLGELKYLSLSFYGFDNNIHKGHLIVHKEVATEVVSIFEELFKNKFPIEKMQIMDDFKGDDDLSMTENNTSAFNCRSVTGKPGIFSVHSYGRAIDINPKINPYVKGNLVLPKNGKEFIDRTLTSPGIIKLNDFTYKTFNKKGWKWGGLWKSIKDYQHFEKPISKKN
ncbi:M15 family metallopeptidase [Fluviispira vulneris]|uniref:M15 family metallopeptidase n=1 Tax=Fluviispira vulneris TaxID=2763012 RepID=UPI001647A285|nr:M15 family metallopeptidase [Fluviispira vulneris]